MAFWDRWFGDEEEDDRWRERNRNYDYGRRYRGQGSSDYDDWRYRRGNYDRSNYGWTGNERYGQGSYGRGSRGYGQGGYGQGGSQYDDWRSQRGGYDRGNYGWSGSEPYGQGSYGRGSRDYGQGSDYGTYYGGSSRSGRSGSYNYGRGGEYDEERYRRGYSGQQSDYNDWDDQGSDYDTESGWDSSSPSWTYTETWWIVPGPHSGRGPQGYQRSDERVREDINERLTHHGQVDAQDIQVEVNNCEVTLKGTVNSRQAKRMAEDIADSVWGVQDVHNQLRVKQEEENQQTQTTGSRERTTQGVTS
jgi:hypothetical protein